MAQPTAIVLPVDAANDANPANETYSHFQGYENRSLYIGGSHTPDNRDTLGLYRTFPTKSGNFKGVSKSAVKLTKDCTVVGVDSSTTITSPIIIDVSFSVPVGVSLAELLHARQRAIAILDADTVMDALNVQGMI